MNYDDYERGPGLTALEWVGAVALATVALAGWLALAVWID